MSNNYKTFKFWIGKWKLSRNITHPTQQFSARGTAEFLILNENTILYQEQCTLLLSESNLPMTREYLYLYNKEKDQIEKYFVQNKKPIYLFYIIDNEWRGSHLCVKDVYRAQYSFPKSDTLNEFVLTYDVGGPTKNYISKTHYLRNAWL